MKKALLGLALLLALLLCLASCGGDGNETTPSETTPGTTTPPTTTTGNYKESFVGFPYHSSSIADYVSVPRDAYVSFEITMDVTETEIADYITALLESNPIEITVTDRAVKDGDVVYLYYEGSIDGELFDGGSNMKDEAPYALTIGSGSFIPGFEEALIGLIPDSTLAQDTYIDVTFPTDYHAASLAGKAAKFRVQIVSIVDGYEDRTELTPEFLTEIGFETEESDVIAAFRAELLSELRKQVVSDYDTILRERLLELVLPSLSVVRLPETEVARQVVLITEEIKAYFEYYSYYYGIESLDEFAVQWLGLEEGADWSAEVERVAAEKVKRTFLLYAIAENEAIRISDARFDEVLAELSVEYEMDAAEIIRLAGADIVYDEAIYRAVTDLLIARSTVHNGGLELPND